MNIADEPLWNEFRETGSRHVFRELFKGWYSDLCRYAAFFLPDMQDAEEVVMDFFIHLWFHRTSVNISSSFRGYALRSIRNRCLNYIRDHCLYTTVSKVGKIPSDGANASLEEVKPFVDYL